jgi:hypothetical protein
MTARSPHPPRRRPRTAAPTSGPRRMGRFHAAGLERVGARLALPRFVKLDENAVDHSVQPLPLRARVVGRELHGPSMPWSFTNAAPNSTARCAYD